MDRSKLFNNAFLLRYGKQGKPRKLKRQPEPRFFVQGERTTPETILQRKMQPRSLAKKFREEAELQILALGQATARERSDVSKLDKEIQKIEDDIKDNITLKKKEIESVKDNPFVKILIDKKDKYIPLGETGTLSKKELKKYNVVVRDIKNKSKKNKMKKEKEFYYYKDPTQKNKEVQGLTNVIGNIETNAKESRNKLLKAERKKMKQLVKERKDVKIAVKKEREGRRKLERKLVGLEKIIF